MVPDSSVATDVLAGVLTAGVEAAAAGFAGSLVVDFFGDVCASAREELKASARTVTSFMLGHPYGLKKVIISIRMKYAS